MRILSMAVVICVSCLGQGSGPAQPEALARSFVDAVNARSTERRVALTHPKSQACMNRQTDAYFSWIFSRQLKYVIPEGNYSVSFQPLGPLWKAGTLDYPVRPTHQLQIDFATGERRSTTVMLLIVKDGPRWYEVLPCPTPEAVEGARRSTADSQRQEARALEIVSQMAPSLRADALALANSGKRIDAIRSVAASTGEDLAVARLIVDLLPEQPAAPKRLFEVHSRNLAAAQPGSGSNKMDISITEVERKPRASRLVIDMKSPGSSVGSSFFLLCSIRQLARQRGNFRYVVKIEKSARSSEMLIGFLENKNEDPGQVGEEFRALRSPEDVIDLEEFAPICDQMK